MKQIPIMGGTAEFVKWSEVKNRLFIFSGRSASNKSGGRSNPFKTDREFFKEPLTRGLTKANVNGLGIQTALEGRVVGSGKPIPLDALDSLRKESEQELSLNRIRQKIIS